MLQCVCTICLNIVEVTKKELEVCGAITEMNQLVTAGWTMIKIFWLKIKHYGRAGRYKWWQWSKKSFKFLNKVFIECSDTMNDVYKNIDEYKPTEKEKISLFLMTWLQTLWVIKNFKPL